MYIKHTCIYIYIIICSLIVYNVYSLYIGVIGVSYPIVFITNIYVYKYIHHIYNICIICVKHSELTQ